jgi:putative ABC transport system permease protein
VKHQKHTDKKQAFAPPRWANRFLEWYCRPDLLEEIQGDAYELFDRTARESKTKAKLQFLWNVIRFFRWKNIKKPNVNTHHQLTLDMIRNIFTVAIRNFWRQPGHSFFSVFGLTAGFTCSLLIMLWVVHESSFDRFHQNVNRLFKVLTHVQADGSFQTYDVAASNMDVSSIPEVESLVSISTGTRWPHELCFRPEEKDNECIYLNGVYASEQLFSVFNFPIVEGDPHPLRNAANIAISQEMAQRLYGTESAIGKTIKIDNNDKLVVTVASVFKNPPVNSSLHFDFALPYAILQAQWGMNEETMARNFFEIYLKTSTDIPATQLTEKLNDVRIVTEALKAQKLSYQAYPLTDWHLKSKFEDGRNTGGKIEYVVLFSVIGLLVVIMAVINLVNMSTARASLRAKEIGIRKVTGAVRGAIAAQFMGESFLMVLFSFTLSVLLVQFTLPYFSQLIGQPINVSLGSDSLPLYLIGFLILISLLAGIYPALIMSSFQPIRVLKKQLTSSLSGSQGFRKALLTVQLTASIVIIIFSGVVYHQLEYVAKKNLGFRHSNMLRVEPTYRLLTRFDSFKNELLQNPSIISVGASNDNPLRASGANTGVSWPGKPEDSRMAFRTIGCSYEFPRTMGLEIMEGQDFQSTKTDTLRTEVLVSREAVRVMGLEKPIGVELKIGQIDCVIIGVVNDFHTSSLHEAMLPVILFRQHITATSGLYITYQPGTLEQSMKAINASYQTFEPDFTMKYWFQDVTFNELYKTEQVASKLTLLFTVIALSISVIGIIGLATFNALRKTKEIGVRRVFGASVMQVLGVLAREFSLTLLVAMLVAIPLAWYATDRWLQSFAYRISMPWWIYVLTLVTMALLTVLLIVLHGLKTVRTNPTETLRSE